MANTYEIYVHETIKGQKIETDKIEFSFSVDFTKHITTHIVTWSLWSNHFNDWIPQDLGTLQSMWPAKYDKMKVKVDARAISIWHEGSVDYGVDQSRDDKAVS